jgi:hypothetical protein
MNRNWLIAVCLCMTAGMFGKPVASEAQTTYQFLKDITLDAYLLDKSAIVYSYARAVLFDNKGNRIYKDIIFAHEVKDLDFFPIYNMQFVSPIGYANSSTGNMQGDDGHCYQAKMAAHSNDYNLHDILYTPGKCIPALPDPIEIPKENCPVLVDLALDGFHLSGSDPAVSFDIDADGAADQIAWTQANSDDAFLCLDRNHNGAIDDGAELFGYGTRLRSGEPAGIGYRALAELDLSEAGGNGDGVVDRRDALFESLCVWNDRNRDGRSEPSEIRSAGGAGVVALGYDYHTTGVRDQFGNFFRYFSRAEMRTARGTSRPWLSYDVVFADAQSAEE